MKTPFILCALTMALFPLSASAQRKGMGPSAIEAARLKKYPPPNYLSHYLPDDRYKIAGKVWKYVSTDLDTYYHLPSSPNMLRQPASRVIGFANAKDAEEAGYVADPTDGTANRVATSAPRSNLLPSIGGMSVPHDKSLKKFSDEEKAYLLKLANIDNRYVDELGDSFARIASIANQTPRGTKLASTAMPAANQALSTVNNWLSDFDQLKPPPRFVLFYGVHHISITTIRLGVSQCRDAIQKDSRSLNATGIQNMAKGRILFQNSFKLLTQ